MSLSNTVRTNSKVIKNYEALEIENDEYDENRGDSSIWTNCISWFSCETPEKALKIDPKTHFANERTFLQ